MNKPDARGKMKMEEIRNFKKTFSRLTGGGRIEKISGVGIGRDVF
jgi:hypothetical protein